MAIFTKTQKRIYKKNQLQNGSKFFTLKIPSISAGSSYLLTFAKPDESFWLPFDFLQINNNTNQNFEFWINQNKDDVLVSNAGTIGKVEDKAIYSLLIQNNSLTNSDADLLILNLRKKGADAQNIIKKLNNFMGV